MIVSEEATRRPCASQTLTIELGPYLENHPEFRDWNGRRIAIADAMFADWKLPPERSVPKYPPKPILRYKWKLYVAQKSKHLRKINSEPYACFICRKFFKTKTGYDRHAEKGGSRRTHEEYERATGQTINDDDEEDEEEEDEGKSTGSKKRRE